MVVVPEAAAMTVEDMIDVPEEVEVGHGHPFAGEPLIQEEDPDCSHCS